MSRKARCRAHFRWLADTLHMRAPSEMGPPLTTRARAETNAFLEALEHRRASSAGPCALWQRPEARIVRHLRRGCRQIGQLTHIAQESSTVNQAHREKMFRPLLLP